MGSGNVCLPAFYIAHHYTILGSGRCTMFGMEIRSETEMTRALQKASWTWNTDLPGLVESIHLVVLLSSGARIRKNFNWIACQSIDNLEPTDHGSAEY